MNILIDNMNESDILEVLNFLNHALKSKDWDYIIDAKDFLEEFIDSSDFTDTY